MKSNLIRLPIKFLITLLFLLISTQSAKAVLQTNLKDPGMTQADWRYHQNPTCSNNPNGLWTLIGVEVDGTPCTDEATSINWSSISNGKKAATLTIDNQNNSKMCASARNYFGIQAAPYGYNKTLYLKDLNKFVVRANITNNTQTGVCSLSSSPTPPPPTSSSCSITGPTTVDLNQSFDVSWQNESNIVSLYSSGWSGPVSPKLGTGYLPACPPQNYSICQWQGLKLTSPGTASVTLTAKDNQNQASTCTYSVTNSSTCSSCPPDYEGHTDGWIALFIGVPMTDRTHSRVLWLELVIFSTPMADYHQDPQILFYGANPSEELYRILVSHPLVNKSSLYPGQKRFYEIDILPIIKGLSWTAVNYDWDNTILADAYIGTEIWSDAKASFTVSDFDVLYEDKTTPIPTDPPITPLPPLCTSWTDIWINSCTPFEKFDNLSEDCHTSSDLVTLNNTVASADQMRFINTDPNIYCSNIEDNNSNWSNWQSFENTVSNWDIGQVEGDRKVCAQFKNNLGTTNCGGMINYDSSYTSGPHTRGDANNDGLVDNQDLIIWQNNFDQSTSNGVSDGDFNTDSKVDGIDFVIWMKNTVL
jgi:hypothetical protein